jgi:two-component system, chemotaxis family, CheB/CheR fusion protein
MAPSDVDDERPTASEAEDRALEPLHVVGVGASAGGLEALEQLFGAMPEDTGMAFVVVQHLSPDFRSVMDELLGRRTKIPVLLVEDGMRVRRNRIYLIPPKKEMIISGGHLLLSDKGASGELTLPVDIFFRSLAQDVAHRAIGIVLSGAGSDGARGIRDIHAAGGLVLCQDEESATFDGMPRSARDTGVVDHVVPPSEIPAILLEHARMGQSDALAPTSSTRPSGVSTALGYLQTRYGIDFSHYKASTVVRRIERRLQLTQSASLAEYVERLSNDADELDLLFRDLLIGVTRFFRDDGAFHLLETRIVPELLDATSSNDELRVWVAGCATGEEPYSLAILIQEELRRRDDPRRIKILATDVHRGSLDFASRGLYPADRVSDVRPELLERYFDKQADSYVVSPELRQLLVFAPHNVVRDAPFTRIDLISCRNMLIYLQPLAQKKVLSLLHFALKRHGILFLGPSETVGPLSDDFETVDAHWRMYRKHRDVRLPIEAHLPAPRVRGLHASTEAASSPPYSLSQIIHVYDALLDEHMPPSLLVNERRELVHAFAGASRYLRRKDGRPSSDLLDMLAPDLRMAVTGAMQRVFKERTPIAYNGLLLRMDDGSEQPHRLLVRPIVMTGAPPNHALITLEPIGEPLRPAPVQTEVDAGELSKDQVGSLETELRRTKEILQATIEELETSNEELQAANEELLASNEELQSTNEELQSVNEELYTVNAEYQKKITELTQLTNDMDNLLASIQVGTIFLDAELCIRKFTPLIASAFNLLPQDIGRPISSFTHSLSHPRLMADLESVLHSEQSIEREILDRSGQWFFLRILPYRVRGAVNGVVLTLIDIAALKAAEDQIFRERYLLNSLMDSVQDAIYFKDLQERFVRVNRVMAKRLSTRSTDEVAGKAAAELLADPEQRAFELLDRRALAGEAQHAYDELQILPDGRTAWFTTTRQPLRDRHGVIVGMLGVARDVTEQKRAAEESRMAVKRRDEFLAMLSHELRNPLSAIVNAGVLLRHAPSASGVHAKSLDVVERQARQMTRLIDDLLEVGRIRQNKIELRRQVIDARSVVQEAITAMREKFETRGVALDVDVGEEAALVDADPARFQQIVVNLLDNASKFCDRGGHARVHLQRDGEHARLTVSDDGAGIDPALLPDVFEPFVQGGSTLDRTAGGMGLGLSVVRSLVEMHGGTICVHSDGRGRGSHFTVSFPIAQGMPTPRSHRARLPWPDGKRVGVIEDNADGCQMLRLLLEHAGYEVFTAHDGESGLALIDEINPDILIVDIGLPVMDGLELARRVRQNPRHAGIYMVALTGYGQQGDRAAALDAGFDAHVVKPLDLEELTRLMRAQPR